jgi:uncharacterized membrane protein YbaN (DUF454 family)
MRILFLMAGIAFLGLAIVGAFLPVVPSTIFVILAAGSFAKSSPRLEKRLLDHPRFGPALMRWRDHGAIAPPAKKLAISGMAVGFVIFHLTVKPDLWASLLVAAVLIASGGYVATRPDT